jgi:hypothetical protein
VLSEQQVAESFNTSDSEQSPLDSDSNDGNSVDYALTDLLVNDDDNEEDWCDRDVEWEHMLNYVGQRKFFTGGVKP